MKLFVAILVGVMTFVTSTFAAPVSPQPWPVDQANTWYAQQGWRVGANFIPFDAINQLEMWQKETFNPARIDLELSWAESLGMSTVRVFLHDLLWESDQAGFITRIDQFLAIADRHHIKPMFVLFDSCWNSRPALGVQPAPIKGVHNSGWVQSPGVPALLDPSQLPRLQAYITGIVAHYANDSRIYAWDVWNEPDNLTGLSDDETNRARQVEVALLPRVFQWARAAHPSQPLTSPVFSGDNWADDSALNETEKVQLTQSDVITFHSYNSPQVFEKAIQSLARFKRPIICTEYMARPLSSTIQMNLPIAKRYGVTAYNWGFVAGKTQTYYAWDSWQHPYPAGYPAVWFHDLLYPNGQPYIAAETDTLRALSGVSTPAHQF